MRPAPSRVVAWIGVLGLGGLGPGALAGQTPEQPYLAWTDLSVPAEELVERRARLARALQDAGGGVFLAPAGDGLSGGETFRQDDTFWFYTGLEVPRSVLLVHATGDATLFIPERDARFGSASRPNDFPGRILLGDTVLARRVAPLRLRSADDLLPVLQDHARRGTSVYVDAPPAARSPLPLFGPPPTPAERFVRWAATTVPHLQVRAGGPVQVRARAAKRRSEVDAVRASAALTMDAIRIAAGEVAPGVSERELEAAFTAACLRGGGQRLPFHPIIKSGPNSLWPWRVLASHYDRRNRRMEDGDLVIFDVGCELDRYVSDVGRTFPVGGRFTEEQRQILEMEVAVADAVIAAVRPGMTFRDLRAVADEAIPPDARPYMQVGLFFGHAIGLSTGDPFDPGAPLEPGMVFTVEPWYYNHDLPLSVFTEDVILVTPDGAENLTASLPRSPEALEGLVRRGG